MYKEESQSYRDCDKAIIIIIIIIIIFVYFNCRQTMQSTQHEHPPRRVRHNSHHAGKHYVQKG